MAACQAPPSLGFSRQEHWSGLPFPSPMHESEKWKWSHSVVPDPQRPRGLQPSRLLRPWDFPGKSTGVGCHCLLRLSRGPHVITWALNKEGSQRDVVSRRNQRCEAWEFNTWLLAFERECRWAHKETVRKKLRKQTQVSWKWAMPERIEPKLLTPALIFWHRNHLT